MIKVFSFITSFLIFQATLFAVDQYRATELNPDGTFKIVDFNAEQKLDIDLLAKEIQYFQQKITDRIPYLKKENKIKDNKYVKQTDAYTESSPGSRYSSIVNRWFTVLLAGDKIDSITFTKRSGRLGSKFNKDNETKEVSNKFDSAGVDKINIKVTLTTDAGKEPVKDINFQNIVNPTERIRLVKSYRDELEKALREIDRLIENSERIRFNDYVNTIKEINMK